MRNNEQEKLDQQEREKLFELRDKLVQTMTPIFGKSVENMGRIVFDDYTNKKLSKILDCKNIGRHLQTPNLGDKNQPKYDSFDNLIAKVQLFKTHIEQPLKENKKLLETNAELRNQLEISKRKNRSVSFYIIGLIALAVLSGWLYFQQPKESKQIDQYQPQTVKESTEVNCALNEDELLAINQIYSLAIQSQLALEGVIFHTSFKEGIYEDRENEYLKEVHKRVITIIKDSRDYIRRSNLKAENQQTLFALYEQHTENKIDENFNELAKVLTNKSLPTSHLKDLIMQKVSTVQWKNIEKINAKIKASLKEKNATSNQVFTKEKELHGIYSKEQYNAIFQFMGTGNLKYMYDSALEENAANNRIITKENILSKKDAIQSIHNMMTKIERIIYESRAKVEDLNFLIQGKKNVIDFADFVIPRNSLFKLTANQITEIDANNIPKDLDYSSYDEALIKCKKYILGKDISTLDIISNIDNVARISQVSLREKTSALYDCYVLYGGSCFDRKQFECYQKNSKIQNGKICFQ